jgi:nucleobase:cation symporter-1, NCS1 family
MGPIAGILVSDFYLIRKMKLDIRDMYNPNGIYRYFHGWNWRAWLTFSIAVGPIMPGFVNAINPNLTISRGAEEIYCIAWSWGFFSCVVNYYIICRYISPPPNLIDEAVFPPRTLEEEEAQKNGRLEAYRAGLIDGDSPDSGSIEKVQETVDTKLADEKV